MSTMEQLGIVLVVVGLAGLVWGIVQKLKAVRIASAPFASTGSIAMGTAPIGPRREISAEGRVHCPSTLVAPFSGRRCLYYSIKCTAEWKEGDTKRTKVIDEQKVATPFSIDDGSGAVWVDATEGGDFDPIQSKRDTKGSGGLFAAMAGGVLEFGEYRVSTSCDGVPSDATYTVEERVLPLVGRLYACGVVDPTGAIGAPKWRQLVLSSKSRDELFASSSRNAKIFIPIGAVLSVIGVWIGIVDLFLQDRDGADSSSLVASLPPDRTASPPLAPSVDTPSVTTPVESDLVPTTHETVVRPTKKGKGKPAKKKQAKTTSTTAPKSP